MESLDLRPHFTGFELLVVKVDEISFAHLSPLQENIILACQRKFHLPPGTRSFSPDQIYVILMELCPLWVHGRPLGQRLYFALWSRMSNHWFANSEQGLFTWLALALKQEVYVHYHMQQLLPVKEHAPIHSAILDSLDPVYDESSGLIQWKAWFCLENFDVISVTGSVSYLIQIFSNPRPIPVDYLRRTHAQYAANLVSGPDGWEQGLVFVDTRGPGDGNSLQQQFNAKDIGIETAELYHASNKVAAREE